MEKNESSILTQNRITEPGNYDIVTKSGEKIRIFVKYVIPGKLAVLFPTGASFCHYGWYKWYLDEHFYKVFTVKTKKP